MYDPTQVVKIASGYLGEREEPMGSNWGPFVSRCLAFCGLRRPAPWCAAFVQRVLTEAGAGPIANRSAGVFYIVDYARRHGWLVGSPRPGDLIAFLHRSGHIGIVRTAFGSSFTSVEGNAANSVLSRSYTSASVGSHVFIRVPGAHVKKRVVVWLPRFELVTSENGHTRVVIPWGKWSVVGPKLPPALAKLRAARLERKLVKKTVWQ